LIPLLQQNRVLPAFLVPETTVLDSGTGPVMEIEYPNQAILFTLGIREVVEQESLLVSIYGSEDGSAWSAGPLLEWPQKFYDGVSALYYEPEQDSRVRFFRAQWKTNRWGRGTKTAKFRFYLFAETVPTSP
jgi:hypothetical protein